MAAETRSFSAAARRLRISQSTVSRHVAALEELVGQPLFVRARRSVSLTDVGASLARPASRVGEAIARFERMAVGRDGDPVGLVRLATVDELATRVLAPHVPSLRARHPGIALELVTGTDVADLERRDADLALRFALPTRSGFVRRRVSVIAYSVFGTRRMVEKKDAPWIGFSSVLSEIPEARWLAEHVPEERIVFRATNIDAQAAACASGTGLALLPRPTAQQHRSLVARSNEVAMTRSLWLVAHRDVLRSPRVRAVFDWVLAACSSLPGAGID